MNRAEAKALLIRDLERMRLWVDMSHSVYPDGMAVCLGQYHQTLERYTRDEEQDESTELSGEEKREIERSARNLQCDLDVGLVRETFGLGLPETPTLESCLDIIKERTATPTKIWAMGPGQHSPPEGLILAVGRVATDEEYKLTSEMDGLYWVKELEVKGAKK